MKETNLGVSGMREYRPCESRSIFTPRILRQNAVSVALTKILFLSESATQWEAGSVEAQIYS